MLSDQDVIFIHSFIQAMIAIPLAMSAIMIIAGIVFLGNWIFERIFK